jgi:phosphatidate cytidylyltransferase
LTFDGALHSEIYRIYLLIIGGALFIGGGTLFILERFVHRNIASVWANFRSWMVMSVLALGCVTAGRIATILGVTIVSVIAFKEFARATGLYRDWAMTGAVYLGIASISAIALMKNPFRDVPGWFPMFMALPVYAITLVLMIPILRNRSKGQLQFISLAILGFIYIGWMLGHLSFLANSKNPYGYVLFLIFAVSLNDVSAFVFGKTFGRHPLRSEISPKKTWEGAVGALLVSLAAPWALSFSFPYFGVLQLLLTGIIVGIGGQLGDLVISVIKRDVGIKDMGAIIPGHGGILDRVDSLIFTTPLFLHIVNYFYSLN